MQSGHTVITADEGNFLMRRDGEVFGISLSLGINDSAEHYDELPLSEWPEGVYSPVEQEVEPNEE